MKIVFALGSNLGDREANLEAAVARLNEIVEITHLSTFYETDPVGGPEQPNYINAVAIAQGEVDPQQLILQTLAIEKDLGRVRDVKWGARIIDIDIITIDDLIITSPNLTVPHPLAHTRSFVLEPWLSIDPHANIPGKGSVFDLLASLEDYE
jgi:2-amino-4-hydroxy-6-hydroxymethyldihydropteridine diphosphokinase